MEDTSKKEDIESLIEGLTYIPGHFHLPLHLNGDVDGPDTLRRRDTQLKRESLRAELEAETGGLQYAVRNMLGFLAYHLDELEAETGGLQYAVRNMLGFLAYHLDELEAETGGLQYAVRNMLGFLAYHLDELEAETGGLQYAVRNMLGFLAYHLDELEAAEETFRGVCQEAPWNLNAWADLAHVYERLGREREQGECLERVASLVNPETDEVQADCRLRTAQCLAEQAFAYPHDVEIEQDEELQERLTAALTLYNRALHLGGDLVPTEEKLSWYFKMATIYIRLTGIVKDSMDMDTARLNYFNQALKLLIETVNSDRTHLKALSWCYIGLLLERTEEFPNVPMSVHDCGLSGSDPLSCYGSGIKLATDDAFTLNQLANVFFRSGKHEMAMGICNMALTTLPDPELNWQAYCTRAKLKVTGYVKALDRAKQGLGGSPDRQDLREARADLERVLSVRPCLRTHLEMGQVFYYMGVDALQESLMVDEMAVNQALVSLAHALQCPLGSALPELQLLRGRCLQLKGEEQNAIDCFRQALQLEPRGARRRAALPSLLRALLDSCLRSSADAGRSVEQLEECVEQAEERLGAGAVRAEIRRLCRERTKEVAELSRELVKRSRLGLVRRLLQTLQPPALGRSLSV